MEEIECTVTSKTKVLIKGKVASSNLEQPLYAVNWFSTKIEWVYHLYNLLASRSVVKIGGEAFFKGKITKTILDESKKARDLILIVYYPSGKNFKALMESTYFKIVSIFRMLSVKKFSFGFTEKQIVGNSKLEDDLTYVIHHFQNANTEVFSSRFESLLTNNIKITYAGKMIADLVTQTEGKKEEHIPNIMDGVVIFESKEESEILAMINSSKYQALINELESSYIGTIKRII